MGNLTAGRTDTLPSLSGSDNIFNSCLLHIKGIEILMSNKSVIYDSL